MPISKERLHDLLKCGQQLEHEYLARAQLTLDMLQEHQLGTLSFEQLLDQLKRFAQNAKYIIQPQSALLALEAMHYKFTAKKNERERIRRYFARHPLEQIAPQAHRIETADRPAARPRAIEADEALITAARETQAEAEQDFIPLISLNTSPDFEGPFKSEQQITLDQVNSTIGQPHEATLHEDSTISCSCGQVFRKSRTVWNEHYLMTHPNPITR